MKRRDFLIYSLAGSSAFALPSLAQNDSSSMPSLATLTSNPKFKNICLSPDATRIAFVSNFENKQSILITPLDGTKPSAIDVGDMKIRNLFWAGPNHLIIVNSTTTSALSWSGERSEEYMYFVYNLESKKFYLLFQNVPSVHPGRIYNVKVIKKNGKYSLAVVAWRRMTGEDFGTKLTEQFEAGYSLLNVNLDTGRIQI